MINQKRSRSARVRDLKGSFDIGHRWESLRESYFLRQGRLEEAGNARGWADYYFQRIGEDAVSYEEEMKEQSDAEEIVVDESLVA